MSTETMAPIEMTKTGMKLGALTSGTAYYGSSYNANSATVYYRHFRSLTELDNAPCPVPENSRYWNKIQHERSANELKWFGFHGGYKSMQQFIKTGWKPGLVKLLDMGSKLMPAALEVAGSVAQRRRRKRTQGEYGMAVDMDRVWQGNLETAWTQMRHETKISVSPKNVALFVDLSASAGIGADQLMWRSAVAVTLMDVLIKGGYSVSIDVGCSARRVYQHDANEVSVHSVRIKDYGSQMSMGQLAAACSPGFFRTYIFKALLTRSDKPCTMGLGSPLSGNNELIPWHLRQDRDAGARIVRIDSNVHSEHTAKALVTSVLAQLKAEVVQGTAHR